MPTARPTLVHALKQIRPKTIDETLFVDALNTRLNKIETTAATVTTLSSRFNATTGVLLNGYLPALALKSHAGTVNSEAAMLALTVNTDGTPIGQGDTVDRSDLNQTWHFLGGTVTSIANWKPILTPNTGVTSLRNTSGSVTNLKDIVTLADVAFSGAGSNVSLAVAGITGTNAQDVVANMYTTLKAKDDTLLSTCVNLTNQVNTKLDVGDFVVGQALSGTISNTAINTKFMLPVAPKAGTLAVYCGGVRQTGFVLNGLEVDLGWSPDFEDDRPVADYMIATAGTSPQVAI